MRQVTDVCLRVSQQHVTTYKARVTLLPASTSDLAECGGGGPGEREEGSPGSVTPFPGQRRSPHACDFSGPTPWRCRRAIPAAGTARSSCVMVALTGPAFESSP